MLPIFKHTANYSIDQNFQEFAHSTTDQALLTVNELIYHMSIDCKLVLCGLSGSGKTTLLSNIQQSANSNGYATLDVDEEIQRQMHVEGILSKSLDIAIRRAPQNNLLLSAKKQVETGLFENLAPLTLSFDFNPKIAKQRYAELEDEITINSLCNQNKVVLSSTGSLITLPIKTLIKVFHNSLVVLIEPETEADWKRMILQAEKKPIDLAGFSDMRSLFEARLERYKHLSQVSITCTEALNIKSFGHFLSLITSKYFKI